MENKFKVGDIVVGNKKASSTYGATKEGVKLKVKQVGKNGSFVGIVTYDPNNRWVGYEFGVGCELKPECFDLVTEGDKIVITTEGVTTTAKMYCGKEVIKKAEAKCAPGDKFDFEFGARLAMDRLIEDTRDVKIAALKQRFNSVYGSSISFKNTESFSFTGTFDGTKFLEAMKVKKTPKVLSIEDFDWNDFKSGKCAIMIHTKTAYYEMLRRIKRRFCPSTPLDISSYYCGHYGYIHYGRDEKLRFTANDPDIDYIEASKFFKKRINMSDDDWKAFDNSDMTLRVTEDVEDDVLLTLKCLGYTWESGEDMTSWDPYFSKYYLTKDTADGNIEYVSWNDLDILLTPPHPVSSVKIVKKV